MTSDPQRGQTREEYAANRATYENKKWDET
jgi:hypothetical protein